MNTIQIIPIFDQSAPKIWDDFLSIRKAATCYTCGYSMSQTDLYYAKQDLVKAWRLRSFNFAFGAYDGYKMIGFIQGDCVDGVATIRGLYVLPEYMGNKLGCKLLKLAEIAGTFGATSLDLVSLPNAQKFYEHYNYKPIFSGSNRYIKDIKKYLQVRCAVVPVFKVTSKINRECKEIIKEESKQFDISDVNLLHKPMFVYLDSYSKVRGFAVGEGGNAECKVICINKHQPIKYIKTKFAQEFDALRSLVKVPKVRD